MLGMRFSDMQRLNESWFKERGHIKFLQQKTKGETDINVECVCFETKTLENLLKKYNYKSPCTTELRTYDKHLAELLEIIFGDETITIEEVTSENKVIEVQKLKRKFFSSHAARRNFASIASKDYRKNQYDIMKATGHRSDACYQRYVRPQV